MPTLQYGSGYEKLVADFKRWCPLVCYPWYFLFFLFQIPSWTRRSGPSQEMSQSSGNNQFNFDCNFIYRQIRSIFYCNLTNLIYRQMSSRMFGRLFIKRPSFNCLIHFYKRWRRPCPTLCYRKIKNDAEQTETELRRRSNLGEQQGVDPRTECQVW